MANQINKDGVNTGITWCDATVNLWWGCSKVHTGCRNCYAEHLSDVRFKKNLWGKNGERMMIKSAFRDLDMYQKKAEQSGQKLKIFVGSMMDIFELGLGLQPEAGVIVGNLTDKLFNKINENYYNNLMFLFLTKRPTGIRWYLKHSNDDCWFGTSVSNQKTADKFIPDLINSNAKNLFLSVEPQIADIDIRKYLATGRIKWVIQGGESGANKRPFDIAWAYHLKQQCQEYNVPYFFKQIDKVTPIPDDLKDCKEFPEGMKANPKSVNANPESIKANPPNSLDKGEKLTINTGERL